MEVIPVLSRVRDLLEAAGPESPFRSIPVKGNEASGFVGRETLWMLVSYLNKLRRERESFPAIVAWGGIAAPEAAAAYLSTGADAIVFEGVHLLSKDLNPNGRLSGILEKIRYDHTTLVGKFAGVGFRCHDRGNNRAVKRLNEFEAVHAGDRSG